MRDASEGDLKKSKRMAEKMAGRKLNMVSVSVADNEQQVAIQDRIANKLEAEARQLSAWAELLKRQKGRK